MAESFKMLAQTLVPNAATVVYTVPALTQAIIKQARVINPAGSGDVDLTLFQNGTSAVNQILPATTIPDGGFLVDDGTLTMDAGDTYHALGSVNNALSLALYGVEVSA